jgi:hypothetical protein
MRARRPGHERKRNRRLPQRGEDHCRSHIANKGTYAYQNLNLDVLMMGAKSRHTQLSGKFRLERSSSPGNEPRDARVYNRIEPDACTDSMSDLVDCDIGKSRDIKIFLDVADACSCGERSRAALQRPGQ